VTTLIETSAVLCASLALVAGQAWPATARAGTDESSSAVVMVQAEAAPAATAEPNLPAPAETPPPPPQTRPQPPVQEQAPAAQPMPQGQWVYTTQYGWVWMPYSDAYTYVPPNGYGQPYAYVYYPTYGWTWIVAPWVWGWGPWPFFGAVGPVHFGWFGHGWWRWPGRWQFAPGRHGGGRFGPGVRPAPPRSGFMGPGVRGGHVRGFAPARAAPAGRAMGMSGGHGGHGGGHR
jgi:hypothetical protein